MKASFTATWFRNYNCSRGFSFWRVVMIGFLVITGMSAGNSYGQSYCIPPQSVNTPAGHYISNVSVTAATSFTNTSGAEPASYGDYSSLKVASQAQNYPVTLSATSPGDGLNYKVYVDYNDNGLFTDPGDTVLQIATEFVGGTVTGTFTIPMNAPLGTHRMRVRADYIGYTWGPCTQLLYGETEDYGLTVVAGCTQPTMQATATSIAYNASFDTVRLNWTRGNGTGGVLVVGRLTSAAEAFPAGGVSYTGNTVFGLGSEVGDGNFVVYNGSGTGVAITGLTQDASYTFTCYEYNNPGICYQVPGSGLAVIVPSNYCIPPASAWYSTGSHSYYINNVQTTGGITNFTNATSYEENSYGDYSSAKIVSQARNFPVTITTSNTVGMAYKVYVDYNDDRDFDDPGELVLQMSSFFTTPLSGSFTIPASAPSGNHRMRIRADRNDINTYPYVFYPAGPCNQLQYGETEDYTLTVPPPCTQPTSQAMIGNYTNLLSGTSATVNWTRGNGTGGVLVVGRLTSAASADPLERFSYTANSVFGSGTQIGTGNFVVYNGTGTSVNVTGLTPAVSYTFTCYDYNNTSTCFKTPGSASAIITGGYCIPVASVSNEREYITNVNTTGGATNFTNATGREPGSYGFYASNRIASQAQSRSVTINVTQSAFSSTLKMAYNVYVDYNDNGVFTDPGELVLQTQSSSSATVSGSFGIPADAPTGTHRMRIRGDDISAGYPADPCSQLQYGETEDYSLTVTPGCISPTTQATIGSYTNNTGDKMTVNWTRGNGTGGVLVVGRLTSAALTDPNGGDSYTANTIFGSGTDIGQGNFVVYNGTGTSVDVTGLAPGLNYTFTCYEYNVASTCYTTPGSGLAVNSIGYCTPPQSVNYGSGNFIENVITSGGLTNFTNATNTETASYGDYSSSKIASQVQNFPITITATAEGGMNYNVYVDYNDNQVFTDPGELVLQMKYPLTATLSGSFTIPATAPVGTHKMRIRAESYNSGYPTDPCSQLQFGETEDYGLTVVPPCTQPTGQATIGSYTNNTSGDKVTVNWTRGNGTGGVLVVGRLTSAAPTDPVSGFSYTANAIFGSGTELGTGNFVVYNGTGTSVDVSGLSQTTGYTFTCYEYNDTRTCYSFPGSASAVTSFTLPMAYSSGNTIQLNSGAMLSPSSVTNQIVQVQVVTTGGTSPFNMTSMVFSTNGSTNASTDIANAKVYYTGTSSVFAATTQFGSTFDHPNGSFTVNGNQSLSTGTNYFWVVYDLTATAVSGDAIDAGCTQLVMSGPGSTQTPATSYPAGNALVNLEYCIPPQSVNYQSGSFSIYNISTTGGITNFTSNPQSYYSNSYANYSASKIASQAQNSPITLNLGYYSVYGIYEFYYYVYIDFNDNGVFSDPGEMYLTQVSEDGSTASITFTIPADAPIGTHRMRVRADILSRVFDECSQLNYGETDDYSLTVIGCTVPSITTDVSSPEAVDAGGTAPELSVKASGTGTLHYQWYSNTTNSNIGGSAIGQDAATYTPDVSTAGTYYYYVVVTGDCGTKTSSVATVTVNAADIQAVAGTITGEATVCPGTNSTMLTLSDYTGTIQWQSSTDNQSFNDISSESSANYTATDLSATTWYRAVVSSGNTSATSSSVAVTVNPNTAITTDVSSPAVVCAGGTAPDLTVAASGSGTLHYQWYSNTTNSNIGGSAIGTDASIYTPDVSAAGSYYYYVIVSSDCGIKTSAVATVVVNTITDITTDVYTPSPYSIDINGTAPQFFVIADGSNLGYQWYSNTSNSTSNGTLITDATKATYTPVVNAAGTTYYYVVVSGDCGSKTSSVATVTVNATPVAGSISGAASVCAPTNRTTLTLNGYTGTIIQWQSSTDNVTFDVIAGANNTSYTAADLSATTWYRAVVISGGTSATTSSVAVTVNPNTAISTDVTTTPYSLDVNSQAPVLNVVAGGNNVHYQWYSNTINSNMGGSAVGQDAANYTPDVSTAGTYYYYVVVSGDCGSKTSSVATVIVNAAEIQAVAGTVNGAGTVCSGTNSTMLTLTGYTGTIQWQSSTDNQTFNDIGSASSSSYRATDLSVTTWYRAVVTSGNTSATTSSVACQVISAIDASASSNPVALGSDAILSATISPAISGVAISFNVDPGTGIISTYTAVTNSSGVATTVPIMGLAVNLYKVMATASCATSDPAYVAVYDPNSSFITGGGWITSPAGALVAQPSLSGKANFGFVAKYKKGKSEVDGDTEFQFQDGNFNFESSALVAGSLVISGAKGTYRGVGTVNGMGNYGFMVSAVDGQITGGGGTDLFRIKIWDISHGNSVVYDNNMGKDENGVPSTILGGGSIVIHYAKGKNSRIMNTGTHVEITNSNSNEVTGSGKLTVTVMPNPTSYYFTLGLKSLSKEKINLTVTDLLGRTIEQRTDIATNSTIQLAHHYHPGVYFATFVQGNDKVTVRLIKEGK